MGWRTAMLVLLVVDTVMAAPVWAADEDPLQDFCVASNPFAGSTLDGFPCKPVAEVKASDFKYSAFENGLDPSNTTTGVAVMPGSAQFFPGVNTLGVAAARVDFRVGGFNPPHIHPRATEIFYVVAGSIEVAFIANGYTLYKEVVNTGEVFVFPRGLVHYQRNVGTTKATAIATLNSQNSGVFNLPTLLTALPADLVTAAFGNILPHGKHSRHLDEMA